MPKLIGALKIRTYLGCSESTFMQRVINEGLPAEKVAGEYVATTEKLDKWLGVKETVDAKADAKEDMKAGAKAKTGKKAKE